MNTRRTQSFIGKFTFTVIAAVVLTVLTLTVDVDAVSAASRYKRVRTCKWVRGKKRCKVVRKRIRSGRRYSKNRSNGKRKKSAQSQRRSSASKRNTEASNTKRATGGSLNGCNYGGQKKYEQNKKLMDAGLAGKSGRWNGTWDKRLNKGFMALIEANGQDVINAMMETPEDLGAFCAEGGSKAQAQSLEDQKDEVKPEFAKGKKFKSRAEAKLFLDSL